MSTYTVVRVTLALCLLFVGSSSDRTIRLAQVLYRHGNRSPIEAYPTDPNPPSTWPQGYGQLTNIGKMQHYHLGQWFLERYGETLLNKTYLREQIYVRSTDVDRTLMSAECNLAGLYPPNGTQKWNPDIKMPWQPIPIHTKEDDQDILIGFKPCNKKGELMNDIKNGKASQDYYEENIDFFTMLKEESGLINASSMWNFSHLGDAIWFENAENKTVPEWANAEVQKKLKLLMDYCYELSYSNDNIELKRLDAGVLLNEMVHNMISKASKLDNDTYRMHMYSAHDTTVASLLGTLKIFNSLWPPTASVVLIELFQENTGNTRRRRHGDHHVEPVTEMPPFLGDFTLDIWYRNDSTHDPVPFTIPGCTQHCPLQKFIDLTADVRLSRDEWEKECGNDEIVYNFHLDFNFGSVVAAVCVFIAVVFFCAICFGVLIDPIKGSGKKKSMDSMQLLQDDLPGSDEENDIEHELKVMEYKDKEANHSVNIIPEPEASNWVEIRN
ncbi:prostatic acid phosphatase-like isoform X3 [Ptychodera flava]|uniref:prostatic acid phosphatase-like isoform X3 n=1 Tax=Ptychodera flava TaxID=63121 RepID=UPI00396A9256